MTSEQPVLPLLTLTERALAVHYLRSNMMKLADPHDKRNNSRRLAIFLKYAGLNKELSKVLEDKLMKGATEIVRWIDKHTHLFESSNKRFKGRSRHLKLFIEEAVWNMQRVCIDDSATSMRVIETNADWPLLQFQFACAYADEPLLMSFSLPQLRSFKSRLDGHPLYDFWFLILLTGENGDVYLFDTSGIPPHEAIHDATQWAMQCGFDEVVKYVWYKLSPWQQEYLGMMHWKQLCKNFQHEALYKFVTIELNRINPRALGRVTAQIFLELLKDTATVRQQQKHDEKADSVRLMRQRRIAKKQGIELKIGGGYHGTEVKGPDPWTGVQFLLENSPESLRHHMLSQDHYLAVVMSAMHRDLTTYRFLLGYLNNAVDRKKLLKELTTRITDSNLLHVLVRILREESMERECGQ